MEFKEAIQRSVKEIFLMLNMQPELVKEYRETSLTSSSEVNALVGFNHSIKGNIVLALDRDLAFSITNAMTGETPDSIDSRVKTSIGDLAKLVTDLSLGKLNINSSIYFTPPPTLITGKNVFLMISRTRTERMLFQTNNTSFSIAYSLE